MAFADTTWYCNAGDQSTTGHYAVAKFAVSTAYTAGQLVRQLTTPAVGSERVFVVIVAGTSASSEPTWVLTRGAKTVSNTVTFQECTGAAALNGDADNTPNWATAEGHRAPTLGAIIQAQQRRELPDLSRPPARIGASEPAFSDTAGTTTTEGTTTWTSLGPVSNFTGGQAPFARLGQRLRQHLVRGWQHGLRRRQPRRVAGDGDHYRSHGKRQLLLARFFVTTIPAVIHQLPGI